MSPCSAPGNSIGALSVTKDHIKARPQQLKNCEGAQNCHILNAVWHIHNINTPTPVAVGQGVFTVVTLMHYLCCWNESKEFKGC